MSDPDSFFNNNGGNNNTIAADKLPVIYLDEMLKKLINIENLLRIQIPEGIPFPMTLNLVGGSLVSKIDFVNGDHVNLPANANIKIPNRYLFSLTLINDGPGNINMGIAKTAGDNNADLVLKSTDTPLTIRSGFSNYRYLNLVAPTASATIRIIAFI